MISALVIIALLCYMWILGDAPSKERVKTKNETKSSKRIIISGSYEELLAPGLRVHKFYDPVSDETITVHRNA